MDEPQQKRVKLQDVSNTLNDFILETRRSFSSRFDDDKTTFDLLGTVNTNLTTLIGKVEGLTVAIERSNTQLHSDNKHITQEIKTKTEEIKDEVKEKKFIIQEILHFSIQLWFKNNVITLLKKLKLRP